MKKKTDIIGLRYIVYLNKITDKKINILASVGILLLLLLMFSDYFIRNNLMAVYSRVPSILILFTIVFFKNFNRKNNKYITLKLYNIFLVSILAMMYAKFLIHVNTETTALNTLGIITAIFIISLEIRAKFKQTIIIYFTPFFIVLFFLFTFFNFNKVEYLPLINVFIMTVVGLLLNRIQNKLRYENFNNKYLLILEKQKLYESNKKLKEKILDLEKFNELFIDREFRIKELKDKVKELEEKKQLI